MLPNIESFALVYSDLLRDGGSAVIIMKSDDQKIKVRVMRSMADRRTNKFNWIQISQNDIIVKTEQYISEIAGLEQFIRNNLDHLDPRVVSALSERK